MKKLLYVVLALLFIIPYASLFSQIERAGGPEHRYAECIVTGESSEYVRIGLKEEGEIVIPHFNYTVYTLNMDCNGQKVGFESLNSRDAFESKSPTNGCHVSYATKPESLYIFGIKVYEDEGFSDMSWSGCGANKK